MSDLGNKQIMAANINRLLEKGGISRRKACKDLGIAYSTFSDWCEGNAYPRIDKIERMADYFGVRKSDLVERHSAEFLTEDDYSLIKAYHAATADERIAIDAILRKYKEKEEEEGLSSFIA